VEIVLKQGDLSSTARSETLIQMSEGPPSTTLENDANRSKNDEKIPDEAAAKALRWNGAAACVLYRREEGRAGCAGELRLGFTVFVYSDSIMRRRICFQFLLFSPAGGRCRGRAFRR
jgi:hypothetical protein